MNENLIELLQRIRGATEMAEAIVAMQGNISNRNSELLKEVGRLKRENQSLRNIINRELDAGVQTYREIGRILHG